MFIIFLSWFYIKRSLIATSVKRSKKKLNMDNFIPLVTTDYKLAFVQSTNQLPTEIQRIIWSKLGVAPKTPPPTPKKPKLSNRLNRLMDNWSKRKL